MVNYTHYYGHVGDGHVRARRSPSPRVLDPLSGIVLQTFAESQPAVLNAIIRGATSGAALRVTRVPEAGVYIGEVLNFFAFSPGEVLTYDSGGGAVVSPLFDPALYQGSGTGPVADHGDAERNSFVPQDQSDFVWWDRHAKVARLIVLAAGFTGTFSKGDRVTTSGGAAFTVVYAAAGTGGTLNVWIVRPSGTVTASHTVTNTTASGSGTISSVGADPARGIWVPFHLLPNIAGQGLFYEYPPQGECTDNRDYGATGFTAPLVRRAVEKWATDPITGNRHVRCYAHSVVDDEQTDWSLGGVTVQCVRTSGVTGTFTPGETVTGGGWSATVHSTVSGKLWVRKTNGVVLAPSTVLTGSTSGATATADTTCIGWHRGSLHWQNFFAQINAMTDAGDANPAGAVQHEGMLSSIWETEVVPFAVGSATWASVEQIVEAWTSFVTDMRDELGNEAMPWAQVAFPLLSHLTSVALGGVPYAYFVRQAFSVLARALPHFSLVGADDMKGHSASPLPYPGEGSGELIFLRTEDYWELGLRGWRAIQNAGTLVAPGQWRPMVLIAIAGQSQAVQGIPAGLANIDLDPDLFSSATFPGVDTTDPTVWMWNDGDAVKQWEVFDIALNGNTFFGGPAGTFSALCAVLGLRMKQRFAVAGVQVDIGFIHIPVNGSSVSSQGAALYTWDPTPTGLHSATTTMTVSVFGVTGSPTNPKRGRFTASSGAPFLGWPVNGYEQANATGSALGYIGYGGNNSLPYTLSKIYAVDPAGTWIEIEGPYVAEAARTWTITEGPIPVWPAARDAIRSALAAVPAQLQRVPKPSLLVWWNGESDLNVPTLYEDKLTEVLDSLEAEFAQRVRGEAALPTVILKLGRNCPADVDQTAIDVVRAAQDTVAEARGNATTVETTDLPYRSKGIWPRPNRTDSDLHHTVRAYFAASYRADAAAATLQGIPSHPNGELAADFGALSGGDAALTGTGVSLVDDTGGVDTLLPPGTGGLVVEDGTGVDNAESLASVEDLDAFWDLNGAPAAVTAATTTEKAIALRKATRQWLLPQCGGILRGEIQYQTQALPFPRISCYDDEGRIVPNNTVPKAFKDALCIVAADILAGGTILPTEVDRGPLTRETKRGLGFEQTFEYGPAASLSSSSQRRLREAESLVYPFVRGNDRGVTRS